MFNVHCERHNFGVYFGVLEGRYIIIASSSTNLSFLKHLTGLFDWEANCSNGLLISYLQGSKNVNLLLTLMHLRPCWSCQRWETPKITRRYLWSTGAFRDSGAGAGAGLGNFWKRWVRVRQDSAIKKLLKIFL